MAQWGEDVMPLIDEMLDHEDAQPGVAYVFINLGATLKNWDHCESRMEQLRPRKEIWREGAMKLLEEFATGDQHPRLHKFIAKYKQEFKADNECWTSVGRAYNKADLHKKTLSWMKDWKKRKEVTAVMVFPVVSAFWHLDQPSKAMDVSVYSVRNYEPDESSGANITLMAFYELLHGSLESCVDAVGMVDANALPRIYQIIFQHIVTILENLSVQGRYRALAKQLTGNLGVSARRSQRNEIPKTDSSMEPSSRGPIARQESDGNMAKAAPQVRVALPSKRIHILLNGMLASGAVIRA